MSQLIIAIDGPSASGKSTVSRLVAQRLKCVYVDSGSLYRGLTWNLLRRNVALADEGAVAGALKAMRVDFFLEDGAVKFSIDGVDPRAELRSESVNENVSRVAALPAVREWIVDQLRKMASLGDLVMEGRDIGTAVFPRADFKFYLDADPEERARRRHLEFLTESRTTEYSDVLRSIQKRDAIDSSRPLAPLKTAPDAVVIQSTKMSVAEVADMIVKKIKGRHKGTKAQRDKS